MTTESKAPQSLRVVLISGMSGAGKTLALKTLEDHGYFAIDNLPASLIDPLALVLEQQQAIQQVGLVMDVRDPDFLTLAPRLMDRLRARGHDVSLLFLDASREVLLQRFAETRRPHPLARNEPVSQGIAREIGLLEPLRRVATTVLDSSNLNVHELRARILQLVEPMREAPIALFFTSFGFKYGIPLEAAFVFDVRYLPNPYFVPELRPLTGQDDAVARYVFAAPEAREMRQQIHALLTTAIPLCQREGRASLLVAIGCTGGQHRSVALVEAIVSDLKAHGLTPEIVHRDLSRNQGTS